MMFETSKHVPKTEKRCCVFKDNCKSGLKVNDQLVAYATRFLAVRLKKICVVAPPRLQSQSTVRLL